MNRFVSCDWGTSRFRLRLIDGEPLRIAAEHVTDEGVQSLAANQTGEGERHAILSGVLERGLAALGLGHQPDLPIVMSGMASSTLGWQSLPYARLPAPIDGRTLRFTDFRHGPRRIRLISGLQSANDVMRGEEVELVGIMADPSRQAWADDSIVILPGSHSKHVQLVAGQIVGFTTYLTGELFSLLSQDSTLKSPADPHFDPDAFVAGVRANQTHGLSAALFQTRARTVLGQLAAGHSQAFLSGVLIGAEITALAKTPTRYIVLAASQNLARQYLLALSELLPGASVVSLAPTELALALARGHAKILTH